ncbi:beta-galactosidase [Pedobacter sp. ISL-68]|uniref:beta-galactosidase n=1 Tax=unclassified Pedobacter TaxID=2628915 RepID=UPI001BEAA6DB|nr:MULTISPECIES: beta-galactosidase [unclassified Pedobacter]MBT2560847.1 beta-galactosidase [Pedobacter sp. ISL-64]MBT2590226.1 beta-galactosidase [Pedobacter sp. ISL-68]
MRIHLLTKTLVLGLLISLSINSWAQKENTFAIGNGSFELNGKPYVIGCGEMHFAHIPKAEWKQRLQMAKAMGLIRFALTYFGICTKSNPISLPEPKTF